MGTAEVVALWVGIPIALLPVAYVLYLTIGGIYSLFRVKKPSRVTAKSHATVR